MKCLFLLLSLLCCQPILSQGLGTGAYPHAPLESHTFDQVNLGNLNVRFSIPIVSRTGRGMPFVYQLSYEGLIWSIDPLSNTWVPFDGFGFSEGVGSSAGFAGYISYDEKKTRCSIQGMSTQIVENTDFIYVDPYGGQHSFNYTEHTGCDQPEGDVSGDGNARDGSGYVLLDGSTIVTRNGVVISPPRVDTANSTSNTTSLAMVDRNGNKISSSDGLTFTDTLGVTALVKAGAGTASSARTYTYPVYSASDPTAKATATLSYTTHLVRSNFHTSDVQELGLTVDLPYQLTTTDGTNSYVYTFTYEDSGLGDGSVTGRLASVSLPTGGSVSYTYGAMNLDGTVSSLTRSGAEGVSTYSKVGLGSTGSITTKDTAGQQTAFTFTFNSYTGFYYLERQQVYSGAVSTTATPLQDVETCYNGASAPCDGTAVTSLITSVATTTRNDGGDAFTSTTTYDSDGVAPAKVTAANGDTTTYTYNLYGEVLSQTTTDSSSHQLAQTLNGYDETTPTPTSNVVQHVSGRTGGNLTSTQVWTSEANYLVSSNHYYDTGQPDYSFDQTGGKTSYGYDSTQGFVTSTTLPTPASGVSLSTSATWDARSALQISTTGLNAEVTTVNSVDAFGRPLQITPPAASGVINAIYTTNGTETKQYKDSSTQVDSLTATDGYGRTVRTAVKNDSGYYYLTDSCYNNVGLLQKQTLPYLASSATAGRDCSQSGTSFDYDALGRITVVTYGDGRTKHFFYKNLSTKSVDENAVTTITKNDSMGRTSIVCEVTTTPLPNSGTLAACPSDFPGLQGYLTTYTYDEPNHTVTVAQGALSSRSFTTDAAGRTTSVTEPESGTTTYFYGLNSTGQAVQRSRPRQTGATAISSNKTNTLTQYDLLGRVISITYDDGTPAKSFLYDQVDGGEGQLQVGAPMKGRLTSASSGSGTTEWAQTWYVYDVAGNVTKTLQCFPGRCGQAAFDVSRMYEYDLVGNRVKESYLQNGCCGTQVDTKTSYSLAGEVTSISDNMTGANNANGNLVSNVTRGVGEVQKGVSWIVGYELGNGKWGARVFGVNGQNWGKYVCSSAGTFQCSGSGNTQYYGTQYYYSGSQISNLDDTVMGHADFKYDDFNRLKSANYTSAGQSLNYSYDRWGNRQQQGVTFDSGNHSTAFIYDSAGNLTNDGQHTYTYDAEGNVTSVGGGSYVIYHYDAMNHRVRIDNPTTIRDYAFDLDGHRVSTWDGLTGGSTLLEANFYWDGEPLAYWEAGAPSISGPANYIRCADEGETCTPPKWSQIAFGANGNYKYYATSSAIACNVSTFGDPAPGQVKACFYSYSNGTNLVPPPGYTFCAYEGDSCVFSGTANVAYGYPNSAYGYTGGYTVQSKTGGTPCTDGSFGDPAPGLLKACYYQQASGNQPTGPTGYLYCGDENGSCTMAGGWNAIAYGANGSFVYTTANASSITCDNTTFGGDPASGTFKHCFYSSSDGQNLTPPSGYTFCALEGQTCSFSGGGSVAYGYNGSFVTATVSGSLPCTDALGDPTPGWVKACFYQPATDTGAIHFQHQDLLGTERLRTAATPGLNPEGVYASLPFGEKLQFNGTDDDANHFAGLDYDSSSDTHHAQFRQYSSTQGRWISPDPYNGSYDFTNPQSLNRYSYVLNNPLGSWDRAGLDTCTPSDYCVVASWDPSNCYWDFSCASYRGYIFISGCYLTCTTAGGAGGSNPPAPPQPKAPSNLMFAQGKGERGQTSKPNNPTKGVRPVVKGGKVVGWTIPDSQTGKRTPKSLDWGRANGLNELDPKWVAMGAAAAGAGATIWEILEGLSILNEVTP